MQVALEQFDPETFSFHEDPVLNIRDFWSGDEMAAIRDAMQRSPSWRELKDMPGTSLTFDHCGNWLTGVIEDAEMDRIRERLLMPCTRSYMDSFRDAQARHIALDYYSYGVGDCLSIHDDDPDEAKASDSWREKLRRRLAVATYFHDEWAPNWGGELILYERESDARGEPLMVPTHCIPPTPGSLAMFAVPRFHRVCRVDPLAGPNRRLSAAGWFLTEH